MANEIVPAIEPAAAPIAAPAPQTEEQPVDLDALAAEQAAAEDQPESAAAEPAVAEPDSDVKPQDAPAPPDAPRSWSKEDKELFGSLPPETQARLAERERLREADFLRRQNDQTEALHGLTAKQKAAEQAQQQYEAAIPLALQISQGQMAEHFKDLLTSQGQWDQGKLDQLAAEDWPRYVQYQRAQEKQAHLAADMQQIQQRQQEQQAQQFEQLAAQSDKKLAELVPDLADPVKLDAHQKAALKTLTDLGYSEDELSKAYHSNPAFRDHRMQLLIHKASQWDQAQERAKTAVPKPQPKPLLPGGGKPASVVTDLRTAADRGDMASYIELRKKGAAR